MIRNCSLWSFVWLVLLAPMAWAVDPFHPPDTSAPLPGTWSCNLGGVTNTVTFKEDRTFSGELRQNGKVLDHYQGTWKTETSYMGDFDLIWTYSKSSRVTAGHVDRDKIEILNAKLLVIWNRAGQRHAYERARQKPAP